MTIKELHKQLESLMKTEGPDVTIKARGREATSTLFYFSSNKEKPVYLDIS